MSNGNLSLNVNIDDEDFDLDGKETFKITETKKDTYYQIDTSITDDNDDFMHEFTKPTDTRKKTKQQLLHEYKKINTKLPPELHRMLKVYCSRNDFKKNDIFKECLIRFMDKNPQGNILIANKVNGEIVRIDMEPTDKKPYNFEIKKELFKETKTYASLHEIKLITMYEQAIIDYLHEKRFSF